MYCVSNSNWIIAYFLVLTATLVPILHWQNQNNLYPHFDSAQVMAPAARIYQMGKSADPIQYLKNIYEVRSNKRVLGTALSVPLLLASHGDIRQAKKFESYLLWPVFVLACWLLFSVYYDVFTTSALTFLVSSNPNILHDGISGLLELPFLTFAVAALYFFAKKKENRLNWILGGALLGIAAGFRPVEAAIITMVLFGKELWKARMYSILIVACGEAFLFYTIYTRSTYDLQIVKWVPIASAFVLPLEIFWKMGRHPRLVGLGIAYATVAIWYFEFRDQFYFWLWSTNFSQESIITGKREGISIITYVGSILYRLGGHFLVLMSLVVIYKIFSKKNWRLLFENQLFQWGLGFLIIALGTGALTTNGDPRYYQLGFLLFIAGIAALLFLFFPKKYILPFLICAGALNLLTVWSSLLSWHISSGRESFFALYRPQNLWPYTAWVFTPNDDKEDPTPDLVDDVYKLILPKEPVQVAIMQLPSTGIFFSSTTPFTIDLVAIEKNIPLIFNKPSDEIVNTPVEFKKHYPYMLVGPENSGVKITAELLKINPETRFEKIETFQIKKAFPPMQMHLYRLL